MKLAFIGASGYGNVGDDTYPLIFRQHLSKNHELTFYNSDDAAQKKPLPRYDYMIFGGGGIIFNADGSSSQMNSEGHDISAHFIYMKYYLDFALKQRIPYGFCSVDIQVRRNENGSGWDMRSIQPWMEYLSKAKFISVRSFHSSELLSQMCNRQVRYFPDLAYLYNTAETKPRKNYILFVPGGTVKVESEYFRNIIENYVSQGIEVKAASFGAYSDDKAYLDNFKLLYPNAEVTFKLTPERALDLVKRSKGVITGRYHGLIFARATGTPYFIEPQSEKYKIALEDLNSDPTMAIEHLTYMRHHLRMTFTKSN